MEITNPSLNASLSDSSMNDDSFTQTGTTVNIGPGAVYNQNCGNGKEMSRRFAMWMSIMISFFCDLAIIALILALAVFYGVRSSLHGNQYGMQTRIFAPAPAPAAVVRVLVDRCRSFSGLLFCHFLISSFEVLSTPRSP